MTYTKYRHALGRHADEYLRRFAYLLPSSRILYRFSRHYLDRYNGDNASDMRTNGEMRWLRSVLGSCRVVFDVGANVGNWTETALSINPQLQVHCFEPSRVTFERLRSRPFVSEQVSVNRAGLGSSPGTMTLYLFGEGSGMNSMYDRSALTVSASEVEEIQVDTVEAYCARNDIRQIDLLKIDVEGNELQVLQGASGLLAQGAISYIQFEYGGTYIDARILLKDMFELLHAHDYQLYKLYPNKLQHVSHYEPRLENFQYQNWIAMK